MSEERDFKEARAEYKRAKLEYVPVRGKGGKVTHATSLAGANKTACNKRFKMLIVTAHPLECPTCMIAVGLRTQVLRVRKPKKKRKRARR